MQTTTISKAKLSELINPFEFKYSKVYYLSNFTSKMSKYVSKDNYDKFKDDLKEVEYEFVDTAAVEEQSIDQIKKIISYNYASSCHFTMDLEKTFKNPLAHFVQHFNLKEHIDHVFIVPIDYSMDAKIYFVPNENRELVHYLDQIVQDFMPIVEEAKEDELNTHYARRTINPHFDDNYNQVLDEEAKQKVDDIIKTLKELSESGAFLQALPYIKSFLAELEVMGNNPKLSYLLLSNNYEILIPDFTVQEIRMSHLTKSLYFLFLLKREIHLDHLKNHRDELLFIYKHISYREDLEEMEATVDKLIQNKNNEIYTHFSRIRSAFVQVLHPKIAKNYYIQGGKGQAKRIDLPANYYNIEIEDNQLNCGPFTGEMKDLLEKALGKITK